MLKPHVLKHPGARPSWVRRIALLHVQSAEQRELVACVRIARCAWAFCCLSSTIAHSVARYAANKSNSSSTKLWTTRSRCQAATINLRKLVHGPHGLARPLLCWCVVVSPQLNSVVCPETQKRTEALDCYPLSGAANQHYELDCESLFPVAAGELRNTLQERQQEERGVLKKQPCPSHSPDRHWGRVADDS